MFRCLTTSAVRALAVALLLALAGCSDPSSPSSPDSALPDAKASSDQLRVDTSAPPKDSAPPKPDQAGTCSTVEDLIEQNGCGAGQACTVGGLGTFSCVDEGTAESYATCGKGGACKAGALCGSFGSDYTCMPYCDATTKTGCPGGGECVLTFSTKAGDVGLCLLPDKCTLMPQSGCATGSGCYILSMQLGVTKCAPAGKAGQNESCTNANDCLPGYYCFSICMQFCKGNEDCTGGLTCKSKGQMEKFPELGVCG